MDFSFNTGPRGTFEGIRAFVAAGRFGEAERHCRQVLMELPASGEAMRLMGVISFRTGREEEAVQWLERAVAAGDAEALADLAEIRRVEGELKEAERLGRQAVSDAPAMAAGYGVLAKTLAQLGKWEEAADMGRRAIKAQGQDAELRAAVGRILFHYGKQLEAARISGATGAGDERVELTRYLEASMHLAEALRRNPLDVAACVDLAHVYERLEQYDRAFQVHKHAVGVRPEDVETALSMARMMARLEWREEAESYFRQVLARMPRHAEARAGLANVLIGRHHYAEAESLARGLIAEAPGDAGAAATLAESLARQGRFEEAVAAISGVEGRLRAQTLSNLMLRAGMLEEALAAIDEAIVLEPLNPFLQINKAIILLMMGRYAEAWPLWEWRWKNPQLFGRRRLAHLPRWQGEALDGKRILLLGEQGLGDTVQFVRYAELVASRGGEVVICCQKPLVELMKSVPGVSAVVEEGPGVAEKARAVVWSPLMSLPGIFGTTLETVPARVPYVKADVGKVAQWKEQLAAHVGLRVGLVWESGGAHPDYFLRSTSLGAFGPLAGISGVTFFGLQKGPGEAQAKPPPAGMKFVDLSASLQDFSVTAAILENMDLLISVDTAIIHVAGAMGRPVWTLLAFSPGHMWMLEREDAPWYPTMRLFRQERFGDWGGVMERLRKELRILAGAAD